MKTTIKAAILLAIFIVASFSIYMYVFAASSTLQGWVTNIEGTQYLTGVNVSLWNTTDNFIASNLTDANGMFYFGQLNDTTYYVNMTGASQIPRINLSITLSAGANTLNFTMYTQYKGSYNVTVVDWSNGRPIPNANVNITWATSSHSRTTDSNGWVILEVPANSTIYPQGVFHNFTVSAPGYADNSSVMHQSILEGSNTNITIYLRGSCHLYGYVIDSSRYGANNITGALIRLRNSDNSSLLNWSNIYYYNVTTGADGYYSVYFPDDGMLTDNCNPYLYTSASGYYDRGNFWVSGSGYNNISLTGASLVSGTVVDGGNKNYAISGAIVRFYNLGSVVYQTTTDSNGQFSISAKRGENRTLLNIIKAGYNTYSNSSVLNDSVSYGQINMTGAGTFSGTVVDQQNSSITISGVTVTFTPLSGGASYTNTTGPNGVFSVTVSSATNYDVAVSANGYSSNNTFTNRAATGSLGAISLTGLNHVTGTITDSNNLIDTTPDSVQVKINSTTSSNSYQVYGNSNGQYSVYIPTTMTSYNLYFIKSGYNTSAVTSGNVGSPTINVALNGATRVQGVARDAYNNNVLSGVLVDFYNPSNNQVYYQATTDGSGFYGADIGVNFNFGVKASKSGYNNYINGTNHAWGIMHTENLNMNGSTSIQISVVDGVSGDPVPNAQVCAYYISPSSCDYPMTTDSSGSAAFSIMSGQYKIKVSKTGYISQTLPASGYYSSDFSQTVILSAHAAVYVYDQNAVSQVTVPYANVIAYSYHNTTDFNYTLNQTIVNVTALCNGSTMPGINITLTGIDVAYNQSNLTVSGESNITFYRVPSGRANMTVDGSSVGCQNYDTVISIPPGGQAYQFGTYDLSPTTVMIWVVDPVNSSVSGADVEVIGFPHINCTTNSSGQCAMAHVPGYSRNFTANTSTLYYRTNRTYFIVPGSSNDLTGDPLVMDPHPGNLSVYVNGSVIQGANVTVYNTTFSNSTLTNSNGWGNFTNLTSLFNVTVNGTSRGYNWSMAENVYVAPEAVTAIALTLTETTLMVTVTNGSAFINVSNVTLINLTSGSIAFNGSGDRLYGLTDANGQVYFRQVISGRYNMTVNTTGFNFHDEIIDIGYGSNSRTVVLDDMQPPWYQDQGMSPALPAENQVVTIWTEWVDNAALSIGILEISEAGSAYNYSQVNMGGKGPYNSTFTLPGSWTGARVGKTIQYRIHGKDLAGHINVTSWSSFYIRDVTPPSVSITTTPTNPLGDEPVSFVATASDNVNVTRIEVWVNYALKRVCTNSTPNTGVTSCSWTGGPFTPDTYQYYFANASDASGNAARDPAQNESLTLKSSPMSPARSWPAATYDPYTKTTFVFGGRSTTTAYKTIHWYKASTDSLSTGINVNGFVPGARGSATVPGTGENLTIIGGFNDTDFLDEVVMFNTSLNSSSIMTFLPSTPSGGRTGASAVTIGSFVYIFGGWNGTHYLDDILVYDITNPTAAPSPPSAGPTRMPYPVYAAPAVYSPVTGRVYIFGGWNGTNVSTIIQYVPQTSISVLPQTLPSGRYGASGAFWWGNNNIYLFGGGENTSTSGPVVYMNSIVEFNPSTNVARNMHSYFPSGRMFTAAATDNVTGKMVIFGGQDASGPLQNIYTYVPVEARSVWIDPSPPSGDLTVDVRDTGGNPIANALVEVRNGTSLVSSSNTSGSGVASFTGLVLANYTIVSNGSARGYGVNTTVAEVLTGSNNMIVNLLTTYLHANITDANLQPVVNANVTLHTDTAGTTIALDATGSPVYGYTDSAGMVTFTRVLPCTNCNLTVVKQTYTPSWNTTTITVSAGSNQTVHLDPQPGFFSGTYTLNFTINNLDPDADNINITVRYNDTGAVVGSNITTDGHAVIYGVPNDYFDFIINGSLAGFSDVVVTKVAIGKIVISNGTTDLNGMASISVTGMGTYHIRVISGGYVTYDDIANGTSRSGSYDSGISGINGTISVPLNGTTNLSGYVNDQNFRPNPPGGLGYEPVGYATVKVYTSDCDNMQSNLLRYQYTTQLGSNYSMLISPRQRLSPDSNQTFCISVTSDAYQQSNSGTMNNLGTTTVKNIGMTPNETVSGTVRDFVTNTVISGATVDLNSAFCYDGTNTNCSAYRATTDSSGQFIMAAAPRTSAYSFLPFTMIIMKTGYNLSSSTITSLPSGGQTYYLLPAGSAFIQVNTTGSDNLTSSVIITLDGNVINSSTSGCAQIDNLLRCQINDGAHTLIVNGSEIGYGVSTTSFTVLTGQIKQFDVHLNMTRINVTLMTDVGAVIPNVTVTIVGTSFSNQTDSSGAVLFSKVPTGTYSVNFSGDDIGNIYFYNSSTITAFNVTDSMAGSLSQVIYVMNDTSAYFNISNSSHLPIANINFTLRNSRTNQLYVKYTNSTGEVKFANSPYGNYTLQFFEDEVYRKGYVPQNFTVEILPGEDWNTNNTFVRYLSDVKVTLNLTNTTSDPIVSIPMNMTLNGSQAVSGLGEGLNGTTNSSGELILHEVVPTSYSGTYAYTIDANTSGYGIMKDVPLTVGLSGVSISEMLSPLSITVMVRDSSGSALSSPGVNISLMVGGSVAQNITGSYLNATGVTDSVTFTHLYVENYTINITSVSYFSQNTTVDLGAASTGVTESNFTMVARTLTVNIFDPNGNPVTQNVETRVYNTTHDVATNTTGDNLYKNTTTGSLMFYGIMDGMFNVSVESENYTRVQNWTFDTSAGMYEHNFTMTPRVFTVYINDTNGGAITELVEARIYNSTDVETNITNDLMYHNTTIGFTIFNGIRDGTFNVSVVSENYTAQNWTLDTSLGPYIYTFHLTRTGIGYFNITIRDNTTLAVISGATVTLYNMTETVTSGTTGSDGRVTLQTNVSAYNESLYVNASYTGYDANSTGPYNITAGEIKNITLTISQTPVSPPPYTPPPPSGGGGGGSSFSSGGGGGSVCTESWTCSSWSPCIGGEQTRTCTDSNSCGTVKNRPALEQSCTISMSVSVTDAYLNAGDCGSSTLSIRNTGTSDIAGVEVDDPFTITDCCSVTPAQTSISLLPAGQTRTILLQVCAGMYIEKGDYTSSVEVRANGLKASDTLYAHVTRNYAEVLQDRISALEAQMEAINLGTLDSVQIGLLNLAREQLDLARAYISAGNYEGATRALDAAEDYMSQLRAHTPEAMDMSWLMTIVLPLAVVLIIGFAGWQFLVRRRTKAYRYKPPRYYPTAAMPPKVDKGFLLKELKSLESKVLGIRKDRLAATDRYYYEKARRALENMEHHIMQDNIASAKVLLNEAETSLRVLESRLLSFDIIKKHEGS